MAGYSGEDMRSAPRSQFFNFLRLEGVLVSEFDPPFDRHPLGLFSSHEGRLPGQAGQGTLDERQRDVLAALEM